MAEPLDELRSELASRQELVGSLAHDLKGLATGIEGGLYMVESGIAKGKQDRVAKGIEMARRNLGRMRRTLGSELYYVKDRELVHEPVELGPLLQAVYEELVDYADSLGVTLNIGSATGAPASDDLALRALISNIAEWAVVTCGLARPATPTVTLEAKQSASGCEIRVTANGAAVAPEITEQLTAGRYQPVAGDRGHAGLFIAGHLVRALGGTLAIAAEPTGGARIAVRLT